MRQGSLLLLLLCQLYSYTSVASHKVCGRPPAGPNFEDGHHQRVYEPGQEVHLACKPGYASASGPRKITCGAGGEWSSSAFKCEPITCSSPGPLKNGVIQMAANTYRSTINYTCAEGYILHGPKTSECLHDGTWSNPLPVCKPVTCGLPEIPKFATFRYSRNIQGNTTSFGDSVAYQCPPPLAIFGNEVGFCLPDGSWSKPPECRLVTCPPPTGIPNGFISFAVIREHSYKERVKYGCNDNYVLDGHMEVECEKSGNWSTKPVCRAPCTIGFDRGRIFYNNKKMWVEDLKHKRLLHNEMLAVYCKNEEKKCGYPVVTKCIDGALKIPECFKEPGRMQYKFKANSLPSEIEMC